MQRKHVLTLIQVALAVGLLAFVLSKVPWRDTASPTKAGEAEIVGTITAPAGPRPWESKTTVTLETATGPVVVESAKFDVKPGLITLWRHLEPLPYFLGAALLLAGAFLAFARWWMLVRVLRIPFTYGAAVKWSFVGFFFNNVIPGLIGGDLPKMYFVARDAPNKAHAVLTVAVDRIIGLFGLALVAGVALLFELERYLTPDLRWIGVLIGGVLVGTLVGMVILGNRTLRGLFLRNAFLAKLPGGRILSHLDEAFELYAGRPGVLFVALLLSCGNHVLSMFAWWCFAFALGGTLTVGATFVVVPMIQMVKSVPLTPSGWGVGEAMFAKLLPLYGESAALGVALSITYTLTYMVFSLVGGVILLTSRDRVSTDEMKRSLES